MEGLKRLRTIRGLSQNNPRWVHRELFRILHKEDIWIAAYENIKGNKGALTPSVSSETLDGTSLEKLRRLQSSVTSEKYRFSPVKQILIPKPNGQQRPLGLPSANDKIVQEVIRLILEAIYEPNFDSRSFGFRSGMGVHDALAYVEDQFRWTDWIIKGDIKNAYPTIDHEKLCQLLTLRIQDQRFMNLIRKSLKCGVYDNPKLIHSKIGVPQGSVVSPILANIYFHELDQWVQKKSEEVYVPNDVNKRNPAYRQLEYNIQKAVKLKDAAKNPKEKKSFVRVIKHLIQKRNNTPRQLDKGIEIRYARYADDWIVGVKGPQSLAEQIKSEISIFFRDHLKQELDPVKTQVIQIRAGKVLFLGYDIFLPRHMKLVKYKKGSNQLTVRRSSRRLRMEVPVDRVVKRLQERGYVMYGKYGLRPISKGSYTPLEDRVIVNHFRSVWLGLYNFYSGATDRSHLQYIHYLLHSSCAMTLAHRHRSTSRKIFKKHGKELKILRKKGKDSKVIASFPYHTSWKISDRKWQKALSFKDPFTTYANRVSRTRLGQSCLICKSTVNIEMHHVKHVRKQGYRYHGFQAEMSLLNRKQVPLCRQCHIGVHMGLHDGIKLTVQE